MVSKTFSNAGSQLISGAPEGLDAQIIADSIFDEGFALYVACDDVGLDRMKEALSFFAPELEILVFPSWDCLPYDRVSPKNDVISTRIQTLSKLLEVERLQKTIIVTTMSAFLQ